MQHGTNADLCNAFQLKTADLISRGLILFVTQHNLQLEIDYLAFLRYLVPPTINYYSKLIN